MELRVAAKPASVSRCRHWTAFMARTHGAPARTVETIELLTSELVTMAVTDAVADSIVVRFRRWSDGLEVDVSYEGDGDFVDPWTVGVPERRHGMTLLTEIDCERGTRQAEDGHGASVWFKVAA